MRNKRELASDKLAKRYNLTYKEATALYSLLARRNFNALKPITIMNIRNQAKRYYIAYNRLINAYKLWLDDEAKALNKKAINGLIVRRAQTGALITNEIYFIDDLETIYKMLNCELIDIQERIINNKIYDFICDDEMLLKEPKQKQIIATDETGKEIFYKYLLILGQAKNKAEQSLAYDDISAIIRSTKTIKTDDGETIKVLTYNI